MRILQVLPQLKNGGVERGTLDVAQALMNAGHEAFVASQGGPMVTPLKAMGAHHITLPLATKMPWTIVSNALALKKLIETHDIDLVHARSRLPAWCAQWVARKTGTPFVTTVHGAYGLSGWGKRAYNRVMVQGDRVIAVSQYIQDYIIQEYATDPSIIRLIPRGVDQKQFDPNTITPDQKTHCRQQWNVPLDAIIILMPGRLSRIKGCEILIQALGILNNPKIHGIFLGGDHPTYVTELLQLAQNCGVKNQVHFIPATSQMAAAYGAADVVVSASLKPESFGRTIIEAQAMEIPVIAPAHGGALELIEPGTTGWLTPSGDAKALAQTLDAAIKLPYDQKKAMTTLARNRVLASYTNDTMCEKTLRVYAELLQEKK